LTPEERDIVRKLLVKYQASLSLAEELALTMLDALQPEEAPPDPAQRRERRRAMGDALAMIESGDEFAAGLWTQLGLDRRTAARGGVLPAEVQRDRRKGRKRTSSRVRP
jgi:hypothetical protein